MLINYYSLRREGAERDLRVIKENVFTYDKKAGNPKEIVELMCNLFDLRNLAEERLYMLVLDGPCICGIFEISRGGFNSTLASPREIYSKALLIGGCGIILIHNHPSWKVEPSEDDIRIADMVNDAGDILDIKLVDFIIVGDGYYSFHEKGLL